MSSPLKRAVLAATRRILGPLTRLLLEAGVGIGEFQVLARRAYVQSAQASSPEGHRTNISRIASLTGLRRPEVREILATDEESPPEPAYGRHRAERVLTGWWTDSDFLDREGDPALLPLRGPRRSFAALVKRYSGEPRVITLLDELIRVKAVRRLPDGRLEAISRTYATARWDPAGIDVIGDRIHDHLETLLHNVKSPARRRFERVVANAQVDPRYVPMLIRDMTEQLDVMGDSMEDALNDPAATLTPTRKPKDGVRLGIAMYMIEEPVVVQAPADESKPKSDRRRRKSESGT